VTVAQIFSKQYRIRKQFFYIVIIFHNITVTNQIYAALVSK